LFKSDKFSGFFDIAG